MRGKSTEEARKELQALEESEDFGYSSTRSVLLLEWALGWHPGVGRIKLCVAVAGGSVLSCTVGGAVLMDLPTALGRVCFPSEELGTTTSWGDIRGCFLKVFEGNRPDQLNSVHQTPPFILGALIGA